MLQAPPSERGEGNGSPGRNSGGRNRVEEGRGPSADVAMAAAMASILPPGRASRVPFNLEVAMTAPPPIAPHPAAAPTVRGAGGSGNGAAVGGRVQRALSGGGVTVPAQPEAPSSGDVMDALLDSRAWGVPPPPWGQSSHASMRDQAVGAAATAMQREAAGVSLAERQGGVRGPVVATVGGAVRFPRRVTGL